MHDYLKLDKLEYHDDDKDGLAFLRQQSTQQLLNELSFTLSSEDIENYGWVSEIVAELRRKTSAHEESRMAGPQQ